MIRSRLALCLVLCGCGRSGSDSTPAPAPSPAPPPPASQPAEPAAGKVVSIDGSVTARRAAAEAIERPLAIDAPVFGDDTITTPPNGSIGILLAHNGVTWTLEGGKSRRVDSSLAWTAPAGSASAGPLAEADPAVTGAAGRHAEQEAAHTAATVKREAEEEKAKKAGVLKVLGARSDDGDHAVLGRSDGNEAGGLGGIGIRGGGGGGGSGIAAGGAGLGGGGRPGNPSRNPPAGRITVTLQVLEGDLDPAAARRMVMGRLPQARACYLRALMADPNLKGSISLDLSVVAKGVVANARLDSDSTGGTGLAACFIASARAMRFPPSPSEESSELRLVWKLAPE